MTTWLNVKNNAESALVSGITAVATSLSLVAGDGAKFPADSFNITIDDEIIYCSVRSNDTCTIVRAQEGTVAANHSAGAIVSLNVTAAMFAQLQTSCLGRNAIINGCGMVNQRVTALTLVKDVYGISADRFYGMATGTLVSAGTLTNTATANCGISGYAFKFAAVTLTGAGVLWLRYRMEARDALRFKNQTASFACRVYHDTGIAVNYTVYIRKPTVADNFASVTAISNSAAVSVATATATDLNYIGIAMGDCSNGIEIELKVECGAITLKNYEFTECQFEIGVVATSFEYRPHQMELALCQRYTYAIVTVALAESIAFGVAASTVLAYPSLFLPILMRIKPALTATAADWQLKDTLNAGVDVTALIIDDLNFSSNRMVTLKATVAAGLTAYRPYYLVGDGTVGRILLLTAEL